MKYVMYDVNGLGVPILFPEHIGHSDIHRSIMSQYPGWKLQSAGFCSVTCDNRVRMWGKSASLNVASKDEDLYWLSKCLLGDS